MDLRIFEVLELVRKICVAVLRVFLGEIEEMVGVDDGNWGDFHNISL